MYVAEMLKLVHSKRGRQDAAAAAAANTAPQYIMLRDGLMTFGRSYKADVKIMLPYISRRHFSVSLLLCLSNGLFTPPTQRGKTVVSGLQLCSHRHLDKSRQFCLVSVGGVNKP